MLANGSELPVRSALLRATVTICVPDADRELAMASFDENFPVPSKRRESNSRPAIVIGSGTYAINALSIICKVLGRRLKLFLSNKAKRGFYEQGERCIV